MLLALLSGCLFDSQPYEQRLLELRDSDGDGAIAEEGGGDDCNDTDASVHPGAQESPYDGVDQDCDGSDLVDVDGDGQASEQAGGPDCDDQNPSVYSGADDACYDGIDADCAGDDDDDCDRDGFASESGGGNDCDDADDGVYPGAPEGWHDLRNDNDCDGRVDDPVRQRLGEADRALAPPVSGGRFGSSIALLPDVDGDAVRDLAISAPEDPTAGAESGSVYLAFSTTFTSTSRVTLTAGAPRVEGAASDLLGSSIGSGWQEGSAALFIGALGAEEDAGVVVAFDADTFAAADGPLDAGTASASFAGPPGATWFGASLSTEDLDGDGVSDLAVTSSEGLSLWFAPPRGASAGDSPDVYVAFREDGTLHWFQLSTPGDVDGDGTPDLGVTQGGGAESEVGAALYTGGSFGAEFPAEAFASFVGTPTFGRSAQSGTGDRIAVALNWQASAYRNLRAGTYDPLVDADHQLFRTTEEQAFTSAVHLDLGVAGPGFLLGAPLAATGVEEGECVFWPESQWQATAWSAELALRLGGAEPGDRACWSLLVGDDYNADGVDDVLVGAILAEGSGDEGRVYVQFAP